MAEWFETWFDSPYYHVLYASRTTEEAAFFLNNLSQKLSFQHDWLFCDLCCGKGRHSISLNAMGFKVVGLDLSPNSIKTAKLSENASLHFYEHDIRNTFKKASFDVVLNLFTSFGYFESNAENQACLVKTAASIKPGGLLILDYMNSRGAIETFQTSYVKTVAGIDFNISKYIENGYIYKNISFDDQGRAYNFTERVKLIFLEDFQSFFAAAGLKLELTFGNYALDPYVQTQSNRLIMVCRKK
jgi:2-polyprenyl-3-methyl-5-hydroxy-6-metoxy-1,4-benzoquinol methylase